MSEKAARTTIAFGVAGWSYPDWRTTVYRVPSGPVQPDLFGGIADRTERCVRDELAFLSSYVDMIEINSSFYRIPAASHARSWCRRVESRADFFFTAKLNSLFTHRFERDPAAAAAFRKGLRPLREAGLLRALLVQFRYDVADTPRVRRHVRWICQQFAAFSPLVFEFRHSSWETEAARHFLQDLGVSIAALDYPAGNTGFRSLSDIGETGYFRLHGRNRRAWYARDASVEETYNYDYNQVEIAQLADRSRAMSAQNKELILVANNHYRGKALSAALRLKASLTGQKVSVPPALLETYPYLQSISDAE